MNKYCTFVVALGIAVCLWLIHGTAFSAETFSNAEVDQAQSINNSFNSASPIRQMPITPAAPVTLRGGPSYFSGPGMDMGKQFIPATQLAAILNMVDTTQAFIGDDENDDIQAHVVIFQKTEADCKCVKFEVISKDTKYNPNEPLAVGSVSTDEEEVSSATLAAKLCQIAHEVGASRVVILREGITAKLYSSGWGVGLSNSISVVNASPTGIGGFATSGTGYSSGSAYYIKLPYMSVAFLK